MEMSNQRFVRKKPCVIDNITHLIDGDDNARIRRLTKTHQFHVEKETTGGVSKQNFCVKFRHGHVDEPVRCATERRQRKIQSEKGVARVETTEEYYRKRIHDQGNDDHDEKDQLSERDDIQELHHGMRHE